MLESGCIRTGAVIRYPTGQYALGDLYHYGDCFIFRHRAIVDRSPRDTYHGELIDYRHDWPVEDNLFITIATHREFVYFGYDGRPV